MRARLPEIKFSLPPQVMLDLEDCPRLRRRRVAETDKSGALRAVSLSETKSRSESKHICQTNVYRFQISV